MFRMSVWVLVGVFVAAPALGQEQIQWETGADAVLKLFEGGQDKPVLLFVTSRPKILEKLGTKKGCFADKNVIGLSGEFICIFYEKGDDSDKDALERWNKLSSAGLSAYAGKLTFLRPGKIKATEGVTIDDNKKLRAGFKGLKPAMFTQLRTSVSGKSLAGQMERLLRVLDPKRGKKKKKNEESGNGIKFSEPDPEPEPKKTAEGKPDTKKKPEPKKPAKKAAKPKPVKRDPALVLIELGKKYEAAGRTYAALTAFRQAAKYRKSPLAADAAGHVARIEKDPKAMAVVARQKADVEARKWLSVGKTHHRNGNHAKAVEYYKKILDTHGAHAVAKQAKTLLARAEAGKDTEGK